MPHSVRTLKHFSSYPPYSVQGCSTVATDHYAREAGPVLSTGKLGDDRSFERDSKYVPIREIRAFA